MSKKGRTSIVLLGSLVAALIIIPLAFLAYGAKLDKDALKLLVARLEATEVASPTALQADYRSVVEKFLPILPPAAQFRCSVDRHIVVFDPANFPGWQEALEPAERDGVTVYPVTIYEDPETRYTVFYNAADEVIATLAPEQDYNPYSWLARIHPEYYFPNANPAVRSWAEGLYDPARMIVTYELLAIDDVEAMAEAQLAATEQRDFEMSMMMGEELTEPVTNLMFFAIEPTTNGMALGIGWGEDYTNKIEVFARSTIAHTGWFVASSNLYTAGTNSLWWVDTDLANVLTRFYNVGNADLDSDADGLTDARERLMYGTDESSVDSDNDGLVDGYSGRVATNIYPGGAHTNGGVYVEGEMTWATDYLVADTDDDGMADGWEVANGHNPTNANDPPNVSGKIIYNGYQWWGPITVVATTSSNSWSTDHCVVLDFPGSYRIPNLSATNYWIKAWMDSSGYETADYPDATGFFTNNPVLITNKVGGVDIVLTDPDYDSDSLPDWWELTFFNSITNWNGANDPDGDQYTNLEEYEARTHPFYSASHPWNISGTLTYTGPQTGTIYIAACTSATEWAADQNVTLTTPGTYVITHLPPDRDYWIRAWRDSYADGVPIFGEAWGEFQDNPVTLNANAAGVDVVLQDKDSDGDSLPDWWEVLYGFDPHNGGGEDASAWWKFDATAGTNVQDSTSHTNHGVLFNAGSNSWTSGAISNGLSFDGVDDYVQTPDSDSLKPNFVSVALWLNPFRNYTNGSAVFFSKQQGSTGYRLSYEQGALSFLVCASGEKAISQPCNLVSGVWRHVVGTYGGDSQKLYVDGVLVAETNYYWGTGFGFIDQGTTSPRIGATPGTASNLFAGLIDDVQVYAGELISNQVWGIYEPGSDEDGDGLSAWQEHDYGLDPSNPDVDGDGLSDGEELKTYGTDPLMCDTDHDGLSDGEEVGLYDTDPMVPDTDADGLQDGAEIFGDNAYSVTVSNNMAWVEPGVNAVWVNQWSDVVNGRVDAGCSSPIAYPVVIGAHTGSTVRVAVDGYIAIDAGVASNVQSARINMPDSNLCVAAFWDDLTISATTGMAYEVSGTGCASRLTVSWLGAEVKAGGERLDIQSVYCASNRSFVFNYRGEANAFPSNAFYTVGIWGSNKSPNVCVSFNGTGKAIEPDQGLIFRPAFADPKEPDSDGDGIDDGQEAAWGFDPACSNAPTEDWDGDGLTLAQEMTAGTDVIRRDTDGDGLSDGEDYNPLVPDTLVDSEEDYVINWLEYSYGSSTTNANTDGDAAFDYEEIDWGSNPVSALDEGIPPEETVDVYVDMYSDRILPGRAGNVELWLGNIRHRIPPGEVYYNQTYKLAKGRSYNVSFQPVPGETEGDSAAVMMAIDNVWFNWGSTVGFAGANVMLQPTLVLEGQATVLPTTNHAVLNIPRIYIQKQGVNLTEYTGQLNDQVSITAVVEPSMDGSIIWRSTIPQMLSTTNGATTTVTLLAEAVVTAEFWPAGGEVPITNSVSFTIVGHVHRWGEMLLDIPQFIRLNDNDSNHNGIQDRNEGLAADVDIAQVQFSFEEDTLALACCTNVYQKPCRVTLRNINGSDKVRNIGGAGTSLIVSNAPPEESPWYFGIEGTNASSELFDVRYEGSVIFSNQTVTRTWSTTIGKANVDLVAHPLDQCVLLNEDDDNANGTNDLFDTNAVQNEDELFEIPTLFTFEPDCVTNGLLALSVTNGVNRVRFWADHEKTFEIEPNVPRFSPEWGSTIFVEGILQSTQPGDVSVSWYYTNGLFVTQDVIRLTVVKADIDLQNVPEAKENVDWWNNFVFYNHDDDNTNCVIDVSDLMPVTNENDLVKISLYAGPTNLTGYFVLESSNSLVRVWDGPGKTNQLNLPASWSASAWVNTNFWVEGNSDWYCIDSLTFRYTNQVSDLQDCLKFLIFNLDLSLVGLPDGREGTIGGLVGINSDDDNENGTSDYLDVASSNFDDDLIELFPFYNIFIPNGFMKLEVLQGADHIKLWGQYGTYGTRTSEFTLTNAWILTQNWDTEVLSVEGIALSDAPDDVTIRLSYSNGTFCAVDTVKLTVIKVASNLLHESRLVGEAVNAAFCVTPDSYTNIVWEIFPVFQNGPHFASGPVWGQNLGYTNYGTNVYVSPGTIGGTYIIRAAAVGRPECKTYSVLDVHYFDHDAPGASELNTTDPLNPVSGAMKLTETDLTIPAPGFDLILQRKYNNRFAMGDCGLGGGWTHSFNWRIMDFTGTVYKGVSAPRWKVLTVGDDNAYWFAFTGTGWDPPHDRNFVMTEEDDEVQVVMPGGIYCRFNENGYASTISNASGNALTFTYTNTPDIRLASVEHNNGQFIGFTYSNGLLVRANSPVSEFFMTYAWDDRTNMVQAVRHLADESGALSYQYGPDNLSITQRVNRAGDVFEYQYDYTVDAAGFSQSKAIGMSIGTNRYYRTEIVFGSNGHDIVNYYSAGQSLTWSNLHNTVTRKAEGQVTSGGTSIGYGRDASFNKSSVTLQSPDGGSFTVTSRYDSAHRPVGIAVGMNAQPSNEVTMGWNESNSLPAWAEDPEGARVEFAYTNNLLARQRVIGDNGATFDTLYAYQQDGLLAAVVNANGTGVGYEYDMWGNLSRIVPDAGPWMAYSNNRLGIVESVLLQDGRTTTFDVNELGWVKGVTWPDGLMDRYGFDPVGNVTNHVDRAGRMIRYEWLPTGKPATAIRDLNGTGVCVRTTYDQQFNTLNIQDELGRLVEAYALDLDGRPVSVTNLEGQVMGLTYTVGGRVARMARFDGSVVSNRYEGNGWLSQAVYPDGAVNFTYKRNGLLQTAQNETGVVSNRYDIANRLTGSMGPGPGGEVSYGYLPAGQVTNVTHIGGSVSATYGQGDRLAVIQAEAQRFSFTYNASNGLLAEVNCTNNGMSVSFQHDRMDQMTNLVWKNAVGEVVKSFSYGLNAVGLITNIMWENGDRVCYTLDGFDRLVGEEIWDCSDQVIYAASYEFDLAGNRKRAVIDGVTNDYTLGQGNRIATFGADGWAAYDSAGCVTTLTYSATQRIDLTWNGRYEITATTTNGSISERFGYDALGRRSWTWDGVATNWHVYDGVQVIADVDATGGVVRTYVWGPGIDNMLAMTICTGAAPVTCFAVKDHLGSVQCLTDQDGAIVESYRFDAWGQVMGVFDANGNEIQQSQYGNRYLWQCREYSWNTGLYFFRARMYDPITGRWLSNDPIGINGGLNQYVFCANDPVNNRDPLGLCQDNYVNPDYDTDMPAPGIAVLAPATLTGSLRYQRHYNSYTEPMIWLAGNGLRTELFFQETAIGIAGSAGNVALNRATGMTTVSRWGRQPLQPGDFVMEGRPTFVNYWKSGKWQPGMGNRFAPPSSGAGYPVPQSSLGPPSQAATAGFFDKGIFGWVKGLFGQRSYNP